MVKTRKKKKPAKKLYFSCIEEAPVETLIQEVARRSCALVVMRFDMDRHNKEEWSTYFKGSKVLIEGMELALHSTLHPEAPV